jgi:1,4-dihydroxy-2-naphthoyl-CoA hydrolase
MTNPADIVPFAKTMGITITAMDKDSVRGEMLVRPEICTAGNGRGTPSIHGGAVMTFADVLGAFGGFANLPEGSNGTTTSESKTNFLNAAPEGSIVYGEATPFKVGRRQSVWQTRITLEDGTLVAVVTQTQIVL